MVLIKDSTRDPMVNNSLPVINFFGLRYTAPLLMLDMTANALEIWLINSAARGYSFDIRHPRGLPAFYSSSAVLRAKFVTDNKIMQNKECNLQGSLTTV